MWLFEDNEFVPPENALGFVYMITDTSTGRWYVGKKLLFFTKTKYRKIKGKRKRIREMVESDWREYWSSSRSLQEDIEKYGKDRFKREILHVCYSKSELSYMELKEQVLRGALETDLSYNGIIQVRIGRIKFTDKK